MLQFLSREEITNTVNADDYVDKIKQKYLKKTY